MSKAASLLGVLIVLLSLAPAAVAQAPQGPSSNLLWLHGDDTASPASEEGLWMNTLAADPEDVGSYLMLASGVPSEGSPANFNVSLRPAGFPATLTFSAQTPSLLQLWVGSAYLGGVVPSTSPTVRITANATLRAGNTTIAQGANFTTISPLDPANDGGVINVSLPARVTSVSPSDGNLVLAIAFSYTLTGIVPSNPVAYFIETGGTNESSRLTLGLVTPGAGPGTPDVTLVAPEPSREVVPGGSASYALRVANDGTGSSFVRFENTSLPAGVTASFAPPNLTVAAGAIGDAVLTLATAASTAAGTYDFDVIARDEAGVELASAALSLVVLPPGSTPSPTPSPSSSPGGSPSQSPSPGGSPTDGSPTESPEGGKSPGFGATLVVFAIAATAMVIARRRPRT